MFPFPPISSKAYNARPKVPGVLAAAFRQLKVAANMILLTLLSKILGRNYVIST